MTIYLCGFMGCGKSTIGKMIATKTNMNFTDLDEYITCKEEMSIPEIFSQKGEPYFRAKEAEAVKELSGKNTVIACGGGTILNDNSATAARENGVVIFLDVPFESCYERIKDDTNRPLVVNNTKEQLREIFDHRHDIYLKNSTLSLSADKSPFEICEDILSTIKIFKKQGDLS